MFQVFQNAHSSLCFVCVDFTLFFLKLDCLQSPQFHTFHTTNSCVQAYVTTNIVVSTGCVLSCISMLTVSVRLCSVMCFSAHCHWCQQVVFSHALQCLLSLVSTGCVQSCISMLTVVGVNRLCSKTHWMSTLSIAC